MSTRHDDRLVPTALGRIRLHVAGPPGGPTALLWPSLFSDGQASWGTQLPRLHDRGWRTLLVDPPGTGGCDPAPRSFTMEECGQAALRCLDLVGVERAAFLGLSWGGFVALRVAMAAPERVSALVLSNTSADRMSPLRRQRDRMLALSIRAGVPGGVGRFAVPQLLSEASRRANPADAAELSSAIDALDTVGLSRAVRSVLADRTSVTHLLGRITAPTLVIAGADDQALPLPHAQTLAEGIAGAHLHVLAGVGHLAPREASSRVAELIADFLADGL